MSLAPSSDEITDFLVLSPSPEEIVAFQPSNDLNQGLHDLLDKNKADSLSLDEQPELDTFIKMGHLFTMLKAKARRRLM